MRALPDSKQHPDPELDPEWEQKLASKKKKKSGIRIFMDLIPNDVKSLTNLYLDPEPSIFVSDV